MNEPIDIYQLLPSVYRQEDARRGYPLKALLAIVSEQANIVKDDIEQLWANFFVDTADEWALPYLGDLVGNTPIHNVVNGRRADIAKTLYYRLRKGTLPMLEELARDVTGWSVHAVAFFDILTWTQNMNHLRPKVGTINLRDIDLCDRVHSAFDSASHTVDIRPTEPAAGWHHIPKVGFFIWRLGTYELSGVLPRPAVGVPFGYHFDPLGISHPLYNTPAAETEITGLASEIHVALPIRQIAFHHAPEQYFRRNGSLGIRVDGVDLDAEDIACMDLSTWRQRTDGKIGIDVRRGRFALPTGMTPTELDVTFHVGFSADVGGGSYERRDDETIRDPEFWVARNPAEPGDVVYVPTDFASPQAALAAWNPAVTPRLVIQIEDSRSYVGDLLLNQNSTDRENVQVIVQAENKRRPLLIGSVKVPALHNPARLSLKGLLLEGNIQVETDSGLDLIEVLHCTLVPGLSLSESLQPTDPGTPSIDIGANNDLLDIYIDHSITGPLRIPPDTRSLNIADSIVDNMSSSALGRVLPALGSGAITIANAAAAVGKPLVVSIGDETHTVQLTTTPTTLDGVAQAVQDALRSAPDATDSFRLARVLRPAGIPRLLLMPGVPRPVRIETGEAADLLGLSPAIANHPAVFVGAPVNQSDLASLTAPPQIGVIAERVNNEQLSAQRFDVTLTTIPTTLAEAASELQSVLRARPEFAVDTIFARVDGGRIVIYSLEAGLTLRFGPSAAAPPDEPAAVALLGLLSALPAIGYDASGLVPGPESVVEESTVIGTTSVRAMVLASNSIFTETVICQRRQFGCMRFSYVPPASVTPARYHCEPDRAAEVATETGHEEGLPLIRIVQSAANAQRHVQPEFTTLRYGLPAYAQLSLDCSREIRAGADNGAEMGVFNMLMQPQREANLLTRFEEYLAFGLEAGLIFVE